MRHPHHWEHVPETVPELIVPDLEGFKLKPYVSYKTKEIYQVRLLVTGKLEGCMGSVGYSDTLGTR